MLPVESTKNYLENLVGWHYYHNHSAAVVITTAEFVMKSWLSIAVPLGARLMATSLSVGTSSVAVTAALSFSAIVVFEVVSVACCANRLVALPQEETRVGVSFS
jgi:hypothetical protein